MRGSARTSTLLLAPRYRWVQACPAASRWLLYSAVLVGLTLLPFLRAELRGTLHGDDPRAGGPIRCRGGDVLAGVHKPGKLAVRGHCVSAFGRVVLILHPTDGDTHLSLLLDRGYWPLLDHRNYTHQASTLVVEIVPADRPHMIIPALGEHVRVTGAYVTDSHYGWRELHPAWQIVPAP